MHRYRSSAHVVWIVCSLLAAGCTGGDLGPTNDGSTLPVPDMTKVSFSESALGAVVVTGTDGAVQPTSVVRITSQRTDALTQVASSDTGAFIAELVGAALGDLLTIVVADSGGESDATTFSLQYDGVPPPAPIDVLATRSVSPTWEVIVHGRFIGTDADLVVRVAAVHAGIVRESHTILDGFDIRLFEVVFDMPYNEDFLVHGIDPAVPGAPGPFVRVAVD